MAFDGIVLSRVTELLNETIVTGRISKLYQISKYELLMTVRAQNENKKLLVSIHPMYARVQLTQLNYPTPDFPNALTVFLRKHIEGSFIERIEQVGLDRILKITLRGRNEFKDLVEYHLYIEIMDKHSNFILTNKEDKILECLKRVSPSDSIRIMQPGVTYSYPPLLDKKNPFENTPKTTNLVKEFEGFSKDLAEEAASRMEQGEDFKTIMNEIKESKELKTLVDQTIQQEISAWFATAKIVQFQKAPEFSLPTIAGKDKDTKVSLYEKMGVLVGGFLLFFFI